MSSLLSYMISSIAVIVGIPLWLYVLQYRRDDRLGSRLLFPVLALVPVYNVAYLVVAATTLVKIVRRDRRPLMAWRSTSAARHQVDGADERVSSR